MNTGFWTLGHIERGGQPLGPRLRLRFRGGGVAVGPLLHPLFFEPVSAFLVGFIPSRGQIKVLEKILQLHL